MAKVYHVTIESRDACPACKRANGAAYARRPLPAPGNRRQLYYRCRCGERYSSVVQVYDFTADGKQALTDMLY